VSNNSKKEKLAWFMRSMLVALVVHLIFIGQLIIAMDKKGLLLPEFGVIFFPHAVLMYCLPPAFDFSATSIDYVRLVGKIIDAIPASLLYGVVLSLMVEAFLRLFRRSH
jgi:hypothetical protein